MKRFWRTFLIACLLIASLWANASAMTMWDYYWGKDGYAVKLTQADLDDIEQMWEKVDTLSLGSGIRETAEVYTLEDEYNDYLKLTEPVMERYYDDVGAYRWVPGLPDEQSISQYQALCIGMKALCDQYQQKPADFIHYYPRFPMRQATRTIRCGRSYGSVMIRMMQVSAIMSGFMPIQAM